MCAPTSRKSRAGLANEEKMASAPQSMSPLVTQTSDALALCLGRKTRAPVAKVRVESMRRTRFLINSVEYRAAHFANPTWRMNGKFTCSPPREWAVMGACLRPRQRCAVYKGSRFCDSDSEDGLCKWVES